MVNVPYQSQTLLSRIAYSLVIPGAYCLIIFILFFIFNAVNNVEVPYWFVAGMCAAIFIVGSPTYLFLSFLDQKKVRRNSWIALAWLSGIGIILYIVCSRMINNGIQIF